MNGSIFDHSRAVIVHSDWALKEARGRFPEHVERTTMIPLGAEPIDQDEAKRRAIRTSRGWSDETIVFTSLGFITRGKLCVESIEAFAPVARAEPNAIYLFVGQDLEQGETREKAEELGIADRVRFLGRRSDKEYSDLVLATDVGVSLRRPPTYGESSASLLDFMRAGVATIVTDVGTFADFPDSAVRKLRWDDSFPRNLSATMLDLARDPVSRAKLGHAAYREIVDRHDWSKVAERYVETIERGRTRSLEMRRGAFAHPNPGVRL